VHLVRFLPERSRKFLHEALKFSIVGGLNTVVDFVVFNLLLPIGPLKANVVSTIVATTTSYGMNRHWTYRDRPRNALRREYALFFLFNLAGFVIQSSAATFNTAGVFAGLITLAFVAWLFSALMRYVEARLLRWKPSMTSA